MNGILDLVDQMEWEDSDKVEFVSLEDAGLENRDADTIGKVLEVNYFSQEV